MGTRWVGLFVAVAGVLLWLVADETGMESMVGIALAVIGVLFLVRSVMLRGGSARPSAWGGHTALGTLLMGIGLVAFGVEGQFEASRPEVWLGLVITGAITLLLGAWIEVRKGSAAGADHTDVAA